MVMQVVSMVAAPVEMGGMAACMEVGLRAAEEWVVRMAELMVALMVAPKAVALAGLQGAEPAVVAVVSMAVAPQAVAAKVTAQPVVMTAMVMPVAVALRAARVEAAPMVAARKVAG